MQRFQFVFFIIVISLVMGFSSNPCWADQTFLWKPVSESNGKLVVLFPSSFKVGTIQKVSIKGEFGEESPNQALSVANGDRVHARFSKPGSSYGKNVQAILHLKNGETRIWTVPNGTDRYMDTKGGKSGSTTGSTSVSDLADALGETGGADALIFLSADKTGSKKVTVSDDCGVQARVCLRTYGPASLKVTINGETWISWSRNDSNDWGKCLENGKEVGDSIYEENPGDPSAREVKMTREVKKGDVLEGFLEGQDFRGEKTFLEVKQTPK